MSLRLQLVDPKRSAHASIRGYLYQACLGAKRWLELNENEALLCEGDEDLDRLLLDGGGGLSEQVKALQGDVNIRELRDTLSHFLGSYVTLRRAGEERRFLFTTTARRRRQQTGDLGVDVLDAWNDPSRRPAVIKAVRQLVTSETNDGAQDAFAWLDGGDDRWAGFVEAVEWHFEAPDLETVRRQIGRDLAARPETRDLPEEALVDRIVAVVLEGSRQPLPAMRLLTYQDLERFLNGIKVDLATWAASPSAAQLRGVFTEIRQLDWLLYDGRRPLPAGEVRPGKLLTAAYEVVPFEEQGRREDLDALAEWCAQEAPRSVQLLTGEGGMGKTRLLIEWCRRLKAQGWHAGFLKPGRAESDLSPLFEGLTPRLGVIDYAETRLAEVVEPLLRELALGTTGPKLRIVLLARQAGDWWPALARREPTVEDLIEAAPPPRRLHLLFSDPEPRTDAFRRAADFFAQTLDICLEDIQVPDLSATGFERTLVLHMAALATVEGRAIEDSREALERTLEHERRFWRREAEDLGLDVARVKTLEEAIELGVAALTLIGGAASRQEAQAVIGTVTAELPVRGDLRRQLVELLRRLYAGEEGTGRYLERLEPDLLGEELVAATLDREPALIDRVLDVASEGGSSQVLTVLTRIAQRRQEAQTWLRMALEDRLVSLGETALAIAIETGDPMGPVLAEAVGSSATLEVAEQLMHRCDASDYQRSVALREVGLTATQQCLRLHWSNSQDTDDARLATEAKLTNNLGLRLSDLGRREDALDATQKAVDIRRQLAETRPDAFLPDLAASLNNLGTMLSELGCREDALDASQEAVDHYRQLAETRPDAFLPDLAASLNNLGMILGELGRHEHALDASQEAVDHYRQLAETRSDAFLPDLAMSFNNVGIGLSNLGRREQALDATQKAIDHYRQLAETRPDAFLPDLASSLNNQGNRLRDLGRHEDALDATQEAIDIRRQLAETRPGAFRPDLASSLNNLGTMLSNLGRCEHALDAIQEAVDHYRELAETRPGAFLPDLASSLNNLGIGLSELGRCEHALNATQKAVEHCRQLAETRPDAFLPDLAMGLNNLGLMLRDLGQCEDALAPAQEAVGHYRQLVETRPNAFLPNLASSLNNLGTMLSELGRRKDAFSATQEAVQSLGPFFVRHPVAFAPSMRTMLGNYLQYAEEADQQPDSDLVKLIAGAFAALGSEAHQE